ncbi:MAG: branched-chain amino acid ABC transporter permease [Acidaminococcales bacterium]|jgi:branched-chain amino acid transport system permease protein|nr:branched-chain amino acid ABC transporter permease [Acidaminococcales bacterium]
MNKVRKYDFLLLAFGASVFLLLHALMETEIIGAFWQLNIILACINIILAASLNLINGFTGQFSIGHAGFMAIGAYVSAIMTVKQGLPFAIAIIAAFAAAAALGFLIGVPTLRLSGDYLAIATLGLSEIIRVCILNTPYIGGASGFMGIPHLTNFPWAFGLMFLTVYLIKNIVNSAHGRALIAVRENEIAAETMGIDAAKYKTLAFTIGAGFAGLGGALFSHYFYLAHPSSFTFMRSFDILTMVVLGGLGSLSGSIIGAIILVFVSAALSDFPEWRMIIYAVTLIALMIFRPQGLLGNKELSEKMLGLLRKKEA